MTPRHILELVVLLERDLAGFYQDIGRIDRLAPFADIFSFMTDHSATQATGRLNRQTRLMLCRTVL